VVFSVYTVQRDDSLSKLAQAVPRRSLLRFYILAKYNDMASPSSSPPAK